MGSSDGTVAAEESQGVLNKVISSLPTIDELQRGAEELRHVSSDGSNGIRPDVIQRQYLVVMRHGERADEVDKTWSANSDRPYDPPLTKHGEEQAKLVAKELKKYQFNQVYMSPFLRCMQTARICATELSIAPDDWTVSCTVGEFLNPRILVRKGGKVPPGNINDWFFEGGDFEHHIRKRFPADIAERVGVGETRFGRYPENLLNSRARYMRAFEDIADAVEGDNVLIVTHGDGVNASVSRLFPWAIVYPVYHTGFTVASRRRGDDGLWSEWELESKSGENGAYWNGNLKSVYTVINGAARVYSTTTGVVERILRGGKHKVTSKHPQDD
eukprot:jgi/Botrbrau1/1944/Bobra.0005s0037.2